MGRDHNDDRRRALVMGKFKFLYQDEAEDLEASNKFELATVQNKLLGPVKYFDRDGKDPDVLNIYGQERKEGEGWSDPDIRIPGVLDLFTVVWSNPFGDIFVEPDIKLFEFKDIHKYSSYNDGPESREFCRFYTSSASKELDGFDSSIFWSTGLLWKHFKTCGVEKWDIQMKQLIEHYKNWREWTHEVHNLPNNNTNKQRNGKKFSENSHSGPASTSTSYSRDRSRDRERRRERSWERDISPPQPRSKPPPHINNNTSHHHPPSSSSSSGPSLSAPAPGSTILVPMTGPDGNLLHVQLSTVIPQSSPAVTVNGQQPRFKYINPSHPSILVPNTNIPPPGYTPPPSSSDSASSSWKSQVDDFLQSRPRTRSCSPITSKPKEKQSSKKRSPSKEKTKKDAKKSKFTPKAAIIPPSPKSGEGEEDVNELDTRPDDKIYYGEIIDWKGKFGFFKCEDIGGKIFVHSKDITSGRNGIKIGAVAEFQVLHRDSSVVGAKAVNVKLMSS